MIDFQQFCLPAGTATPHAKADESLENGKQNGSGYLQGCHRAYNQLSLPSTMA
jgi:hypothetical protein